MDYTCCIYNYIHLHTQHLFKLEYVDGYTSLQAHVSIEELIQPNTIIKGVTIATTNLVANVLPNGGSGSWWNNNVAQYTTTSNNHS
jgi:hypothetical protein